MTKNITDILRPFLVVLFIFGFGSLTACGGGGGGNTAMTMSPPPVTTPEPVTLGFDAPELGAADIRIGSEGWLVALSVAEGGDERILLGVSITLHRGSVVLDAISNDGTMPNLNLSSFHANGDLVPLTNEEGATLFLAPFSRVVAFQGRPTINALGQLDALAQLCRVSFLATHIDVNFGQFRCPQASILSYTPNMPNVLHAAMADTFHRGIGIGESRFAFSGRHNGNDRAAGFTYDMGSFALRTDYVHLPSKQDGAIWLDTYRFGVMPYINDETRFFAGVDSYRNAILALDINAENQHRFGIAAGEGYAVQYELRIRL